LSVRGLNAPRNAGNAKKGECDLGAEKTFIIEDGLKPGERVVAEGIQKVRPDSVVNPIPFK
jgi:hypothetical protein